MFLQKWGEECWDVHIHANKHLGTDQTIECRKVLAIKEYTCRSGHKRREEYVFHRKRCGGRRAAASKQRMELCYSASSSPRQREAFLSGQTVGIRRKTRTTKPREVFRHWFVEGDFTPHHHAVQYRMPAPYNATQLGQRSPLSLTYQVLPWPCRPQNPNLVCKNPQPSPHLCKAAKSHERCICSIELMSWFAAADMATWLESILLVGLCYLQACAAGEGGSIQWQTS